MNYYYFFLFIIYIYICRNICDSFELVFSFQVRVGLSTFQNVLHFLDMNKGRKENVTLRAYIVEHWKHMTDQMMASTNDTDHVKVRNMRVRLGLVRTPAMLGAMYASHRVGKVYIAREPIKQIRDAVNGKERITVV